MKQLTPTEMRSIEYTMDALVNVVASIGDSVTVRNTKHLRNLVAEMRVLSANPTDPEAIERFTNLFTN